MTQDDIATIEEQAISAFMRRLRSVPADRSPRIPGSDVLLLKAQLIRKWDLQRRVQRPIELMEPLEIAAGFAAAVLLLFWSVPSAFEWIPRVPF